MSLHTDLMLVEKGNRKSLLDALAIVSNFDCDLIGENGNEYNWDETNEGGFETNLDYLLDIVKDIENDKEVVRVFFDEWMQRDKNYYDDYQFNTVIDEDKNVLAISIAFVHEG